MAASASRWVHSPRHFLFWGECTPAHSMASGASTGAQAAAAGAPRTRYAYSSDSTLGDAEEPGAFPPGPNYACDIIARGGRGQVSMQSMQEDTPRSRWTFSSGTTLTSLEDTPRSLAEVDLPATSTFSRSQAAPDMQKGANYQAGIIRQQQDKHKSSKFNGVISSLKETGADIAHAIGSRRNKPAHKFFWFKYACWAAWLIILLALITILITLVCMGELNRVKDEICEEPELNTTVGDCSALLDAYASCLNQYEPITSNNLRDCFLDQPTNNTKYANAVVRTFALSRRYENSSLSYFLARDLLLQERQLQSGRRRLFVPLRSPDGGKPSITQSLCAFRPCVFRNDTVAQHGYRSLIFFGDHLKEGSLISFVPSSDECASLPRTAVRGVVQDQSAELDFHEATPGMLRLCVCAPLASEFRSAESIGGLASPPTCMAGWQAALYKETISTGAEHGGGLDDFGQLRNANVVNASEMDPLAYIGVPFARPDGSGRSSIRRMLQSSEAETALYEAYELVASSSIVVLVATGKLSDIYVWIIVVSAVGTFSSCLALYGLGNKPPRCFKNPQAPERMHKVSLRCSCHCGWLVGFIVLVVCALAFTKYQVLLRYTDSSYLATIPSRWGVSSAWSATLPCFLGIAVGVLPACSAMVLSRARAERRAAIESNAAFSSRRLKKASMLTKPMSTHQGPKPNPASLNLIFDL